MDEAPGRDGRDEPEVLLGSSLVSVLDGSVLLTGRVTGAVFGLVLRRDAAALLDDEPIEGLTVGLRAGVGAGLGAGLVADFEKGFTFRGDSLSSNNSSSSSSESLIKLARSSCAFTASGIFDLGFSAGTTDG